MSNMQTRYWLQPIPSQLMISAECEVLRASIMCSGFGYYAEMHTEDETFAPFVTAFQLYSATRIVFMLSVVR